MRTNRFEFRDPETYAVVAECHAGQGAAMRSQGVIRKMGVKDPSANFSAHVWAILAAKTAGIAEKLGIPDVVSEEAVYEVADRYEVVFVPRSGDDEENPTE